MSDRLRARSNVQHGHDLGAGIDGEPHPQRVSFLAGFGAEFIPLDGPELQVLEELFVEGGGV